MTQELGGFRAPYKREYLTVQGEHDVRHGSRRTQRTCALVWRTGTRAAMTFTLYPRKVVSLLFNPMSTNKNNRHD